LKPVKYGVIGVGGMGAGHCLKLHEMDETELVAVADVNEETAKTTGEKYGAQAFTDYKKMIRSGGVEAIAIVTPHFFHPVVAQYAAKHGVHVMTEKPLSVTVKAGDKMIASCREAGVLLGVMFQQRLQPWRKKMRELVQAGELGALHRISMSVPWYRTQAYYNSGSWRGTWKGEGGGVLMNQAPHSLDQFLWLGGQPKSVQAIATTRLHDIEVENTATAIFDYGTGQIGQFYVSTAEVALAETVEIVGENGALVWNGETLRRLTPESPINEHMRTAQGSSGNDGTWSEIKLEDAPQGVGEVHRAFAHAIRENDPSLMIANGEDGLRSLELANAILLAGYTRREVKLPLDRNTFERTLKKLQSGTKPEELYRG
jgi:predicted dehydrogenase